jgi:hypothetical protein
MRLFITMLILCCIPISNVFSQEPEPKEYPEQAQVPGKSSVSSVESEDPELSYTTNNTIASPESKMMSGRINAGTDKYTGILQVQIPLYEIKTNSGQIPISLNYSGSGIKIDDYSSSIGIGWDLSAGGKITRAVRSLPDSFYDLKETSDIYKWKKDFYFDHTASSFYHKRQYDLEPDIYYFDAPGLSGRFFMDGNQQAHTYPYQPMDIKYDSIANQFTIYDQQGIRYIFKDNAKTDTGIIDHDGIIRTSQNASMTWYLNEVKYPNGAIVNFNYSGDNYTYFFYDAENRVRHDGNVLQLVGKENDYRRSIMVSNRHISSISYNEQEIKFNYDRKKGYWGLQEQLDNFEVYANGQKLKTVCFARDTFPNGNIKLNKVFVEAKPGHKQPIVSFEYYDDPIMPGHEHRGFDHWGYWNQDGDDLSGCPFVPINGIYPEFGISRASELERTKAQSLKSIHYPAGGSKEFVYDLHHGKERDQAVMRICGGLRIQKIIIRDANDSKPAVYSYSYEGGVVYADRFNYTRTKSESNQFTDFYQSARCLSSITDFNGASVVYSAITEHLPNGSSIKYEYVPLLEYDDLYPEKYLSKQDTVQFLGYETEQDLPKTIRAWGRNLLQQETAFDADGNIVKRTSFEYLIDTANEVRIPGHILYRSKVDGHSQDCIARYYRICCPVLLKRKVEYASNTNLYCRTEYEYNKRHLPSRIIERYTDGTRITQYTKYDFEYYDKINFGLDYYPSSYLPVETIVYKNGEVKQATINIYNTAPNKLLLSKTLHLSEPYATVDSLAFKTSYRSIRGTLYYDQRYKEAACYDEYDADGNLLCFHNDNSIFTSNIYHTGRSTPLATISNARFSPNATERINEVFFDDFEKRVNGAYIWTEVVNAKSGNHVNISSSYTIPVSNFKPGIYTLRYWYRLQNSDDWRLHKTNVTINDSQYYIVSFPKESVAVDDLSLIPVNATIESQVLIPGLGIISKTDLRGRTTYYEYNGFGLPTRVFNNEREVIKTFSYDNYNPNITLPTL